MIESAVVARTWVQLHEEWITAWLGSEARKDPRTANITIHVSPTDHRKEGRSIGAALSGAGGPSTQAGRQAG